MRSLFVLALSLTLTAPARAAEGGVTLAGVPAGARVRLALAGNHGTLQGSLERSGPDSLGVRVRDGRSLAVPLADVQSFAYVDAIVPSARMGNLLGIGLGAAGGALIAVAAGQAGGGENGAGGGGGGGDREPRAVSAAATPGATAPATSAQYRAVMGAVLGGLAGGVLGALTGLGMKEAHWTPVAVTAPASSLAPARAATPLFAVSIPLPHRTRR